MTVVVLFFPTIEHVCVNLEVSQLKTNNLNGVFDSDYEN